MVINPLQRACFQNFSSIYQYYDSLPIKTKRFGVSNVFFRKKYSLVRFGYN